MNILSILPPATIGIIGGGQLGKMIAIVAKQMGYSIAILEPQADSPCKGIADIYIQASFNEIEALEKLFSVSDIVTYEFENIPYSIIQDLYTRYPHKIPQGHRPLQISQNRMVEKTTLQNLGFKVATFMVIHQPNDLAICAKQLQFPFIVKTCTQGYDGKGQMMILSEKDFEEAFVLIKQQPCIAEQVIVFNKEISVIVFRSTQQQQVVTLPVVENIHTQGILRQTIAPAYISNALYGNALQMATDIMLKLDFVGTLAIEMFVVQDGILINEIAPRPHNSGHFSIEATTHSQFELHVRAICGLPLLPSKIVKPAIMYNILGQDYQQALDFMATIEEPMTYFHLYGKKESKINRKMGHITILGDSIEEIKTNPISCYFNTH